MEKNHTFNKNIVHIKGANFSGKSVMLNLLDSLPITKEMLFGLDGRGLSSEKTITIEHNGDKFVLNSKITKTKTSCSFIVNGDEKCSNGLLSKYKELLIEYDLILIPTINQRTAMFYDLSPAARKDYIQSKFINGIEDILGFKSYIRDLLNKNKAELNLLSEMVIDEQTEMQYEADIKTQEELLNTIKNNNIRLNQLNKDLSASSTKVSTLKKKLSLFKNNPEVESCRFFGKDVSEITVDITLMNGKLENISSVLAVINEKDKIQKTLNIAEQEFNTKYSNANLLIFDDTTSENLSKLIAFKAFIKSIGDTSKIIPVATAEKDLEESAIAINNINTNIADIRSKLSEFKGKVSTINKMLSGVGSDNQCIDSSCIEKFKAELESHKTLIAEKESLLQTENTKLSVKNKLKEDLQKSFDLSVKHDNKLIELQNFFDDDLIYHIDVPSITEYNNYHILKQKIENLSTQLKTFTPIEVKYTSDDIANLRKDIELANKTMIYAKGLNLYNADKLLLVEYEKTLASIQKEISEIPVFETTEAALSSSIRSLGTKLTNHDNAISKLASIEKDVSLQTKLSEMLSNNGLPKYLSGAKLALLENRINSAIMSHFNNSKLHVRFLYTDKKLEIPITTAKSINKFENLSGFEQNIIKIATSLVISSDDSSIVRLDEMDGPFDADNRFRYVAFLDSISKSSEQLFVISHNEEMNGSILDAQIIQL